MKSRSFAVTLCGAAVLLGSTLSAGAQTVVATTSWVAAFARAAGATDVITLAPLDAVHPPEHELRPSQLLDVARADLVLYAGYEVMAERLVEAVGNDGPRALRVRTGYTPQILRETILAIAREIGTESVAARSIAALEDFLHEWQGERASAEPLQAAAHFHQAALAREIGLDVVEVFGPAPLEAADILRISRLNLDLIIDNVHNPLAGPLEEVSGSPVALWINFPGQHGTQSLLDVLEHNRASLTEALR
jgi:zinc transport system substrate-binding protein